MPFRDRIKILKKTLIQRLSAGRFVFRLPDRSALFLTFDDGPHPEHTPALLDILRRHNVRATFFLVGENAARYPELVRRIEAEGHTVGLHTHSHKTLDRMTRPEFDREIALNQDAIHDAIRRRPLLLRPPEGRITLPSLLWAVSRGLRVVHYTITSDDWKATDSKAIADLFSRATVRGGEILSFHDNNPFTLQAVPEIIGRYAGSGFRFRTVADALPAR